jgi:hypothetical protein
MKLNDTEFPFKSVLSFSPLVALWDQAISRERPVKAAVAKKKRLLSYSLLSRTSPLLNGTESLWKCS